MACFYGCHVVKLFVNFRTLRQQHCAALGEFVEHLAALVIGADQAAGDVGLSALFASHVRIL